MKLVPDQQLESSPIVANCNMNRERDLYGSNGYDRDLRIDPLAFLTDIVQKKGTANWLDLCCGTARALVQASEILDEKELTISIVGVDLAGMFVASSSEKLILAEASLTDWEPTHEFDLITCVHGLHYIGDKLNLIARAGSWLSSEGKFVANLDPDNLRLNDGTHALIFSHLQDEGVEFSSRHKLLQSGVCAKTRLPFRYLGADDQAGPNYTGQPAVNSHYEIMK